MSLYEDFENVQVGDKVKVARGRNRDRISIVYHTTAKTFDVEGFGRFWKKNGQGHGDSGWFGRYASHIEKGDVKRIAAEVNRQRNSNLYSEHRVRDLNDDELSRIADIMRECNARRNLEAEQYAEKEAAAEAAAQ